MPSPDESHVVVITTGLELALALANPNKTFAWLKNSIQVNDSDWANFTMPVPRSTNFTISGLAGPETSWPVLGLGFVKAKVGCSAWTPAVSHVS